jgi:hypothetical protein
LRLVVTGVLGEFRDADPQLRPLELQRLQQVKADQLPLAVQRAVLDLLGRRRFDFVTRQVLGEPVLTRLRSLSSRVFADGLLGPDFGLRFVNRRRQARGRIRRRVVISEIDAKLIRVFQIPLAAMAKRALQEFGEG